MSNRSINMVHLRLRKRVVFSIQLSLLKCEKSNAISIVILHVALLCLKNLICYTSTYMRVQSSNRGKIKRFSKDSNKTVNFKKQTFITNGDIKYLNHILKPRLNIGILFYLIGVWSVFTSNVETSVQTHWKFSLSESFIKATHQKRPLNSAGHIGRN